MSFKNNGFTKATTSFIGFAKKQGPVAKYAKKPVQFKTHAFGKWVKK